MHVYILKDKATGTEYKAVPFMGPHSLGELERFCGGDAEFRAGEVIVATTSGALRFTPQLSSGATWIVEIRDKEEFQAFTSEQAMARFTPVGAEEDDR